MPHPAEMDGCQSAHVARATPYALLTRPAGEPRRFPRSPHKLRRRMGRLAACERLLELGGAKYATSGIVTAGRIPIQTGFGWALDVVSSLFGC